MITRVTWQRLHHSHGCSETLLPPLKTDDSSSTPRDPEIPSSRSPAWKGGGRLRGHSLLGAGQTVGKNPGENPRENLRENLREFWGASRMNFLSAFRRRGAQVFVSS